LADWGFGFCFLVFAYGVVTALMALAFSCFLIGLACCLWLFLRRWPFLVFLSVYWVRPCAGRHLLFFAGRKEK
jgi:hypothetical protein